MSPITERRNEGIRIRRDLLALLIAIIVQVGASIWWASRTTTRIDHLEESKAQAVIEYQAIRGTQVEMLQKISALTQAVSSDGLTSGNGEGS